MKLTNHIVLAEKAKANWMVAECWNAEADYDSAAGRFYYSVLQAVLSYAVKRHTQELVMLEDPKNTQTVHNLMARVANQVDRQLSRTMLELYDVRRSADYRSHSVEKEEIENLKNDAGRLKSLAAA